LAVRHAADIIRLGDLSAVVFVVVIQVVGATHRGGRQWLIDIIVVVLVVTLMRALRRHLVILETGVCLIVERVIADLDVIVHAALVLVG
jgi:hypothetical protein